MGTSLGGGSLQDYLINSNTSADGFLYCLEAIKGKKRAKSKEYKANKPSSGSLMMMDQSISEDIKRMSQRQSSLSPRKTMDRDRKS